MKPPVYLPAVNRTEQPRVSIVADGLAPQSCNAFEWVGCAAAVYACAQLTGPALISCVAGIAPGCVKCVT
jgi:hypothetical protein